VKRCGSASDAVPSSEAMPEPSGYEVGEGAAVEAAIYRAACIPQSGAMTSIRRFSISDVLSSVGATFSGYVRRT
jgi:hypothetical protein